MKKTIIAIAIGLSLTAQADYLQTFPVGNSGLHPEKMKCPKDKPKKMIFNDWEVPRENHMLDSGNNMGPGILVICKTEDENWTAWGYLFADVSGWFVNPDEESKMQLLRIIEFRKTGPGTLKKVYLDMERLTRAPYNKKYKVGRDASK